MDNVQNCDSYVEFSCSNLLSKERIIEIKLHETILLPVALRGYAENKVSGRIFQHNTKRKNIQYAQLIKQYVTPGTTSPYLMRGLRANCL
jgi:hypothetical protein